MQSGLIWRIKYRKVFLAVLALREIRNWSDPPTLPELDCTLNMWVCFMTLAYTKTYSSASCKVKTPSRETAETLTSQNSSRYIFLLHLPSHLSGTLCDREFPKINYWLSDQHLKQNYYMTGLTEYMKVGVWTTCLSFSTVPLHREEFIYRINDAPEGVEAAQHRKHVLNGVCNSGQL